MKDTLRPYQSRDIERIYSAFDVVRRVMYVLPTGAGKTTLFSQIANDYEKSGRRVLLLVHRKELIAQAARKFFDHWIVYGIIASNIEPNPSRPVQIASVQTAIRRRLPQKFDLIIVDEAHHATANSYRDIVKQYPEAKVLGVTATPCRTNGDGFENDYDILIAGPSIRELIQDGYLVKPKMAVAPLRMDLKSVKLTGGDYNERQLAELMDNNILVGGLVRQWRKHAEGKKTIVFAVTVEHSKHIVATYNAEGIPAAHVDGTTPQPERDRILKDFAAGKYLVLSNVGIVTEGFDVPAIECVQLCRPTKSLSLYLQMVGRGLRPTKDKTHATILDHANCVFEHRYPQDDREWSLKGLVRKPQPKQLMCVDRLTQKAYTPQELPQHVEDIDLIEMEYDESRVYLLDKLIREAHGKGFKTGWAWFRFIEKIGKPTVYEIQQAQQKLGFKAGWERYQYIEHGYTDQHTHTQHTGALV